MKRCITIHRKYRSSKHAYLLISHPYPLQHISTSHTHHPIRTVHAITNHTQKSFPLPSHLYPSTPPQQTSPSSHVRSHTPPTHSSTHPSRCDSAPQTSHPAPPYADSPYPQLPTSRASVLCARQEGGGRRVGSGRVKRGRGRGSDSSSRALLSQGR
jgi:hypothetical protein